jgi:hypothetical protein
MIRSARAVAPADPPSARAAVFDAFSMMVGAVQISRAINDRALAEEMLDSVATKALAMLGSPGNYVSTRLAAGGPQVSETAAMGQLTAVAQILASPSTPCGPASRRSSNPFSTPTACTT